MSMEHSRTKRGPALSSGTDHHGKVLLSAWRFLRSCASAGLRGKRKPRRAVMEWTWRRILEFDCSYPVGAEEQRWDMPCRKSWQSATKCRSGRSSTWSESRIVQRMSLHSWLSEIGTRRCGVSICQVVLSISLLRIVIQTFLSNIWLSSLSTKKNVFRLQI